MNMNMNEGQFRILKDYAVALQVPPYLESLDEAVCALLDEHVKSWVETNLGPEWEGHYDLSEVGEIWFGRKAWKLPDSEELVLYLWFGQDDNEVGIDDIYWLSLLLGWCGTNTPFSASIDFTLLVKPLGGKSKTLELVSDLAKDLEGLGFKDRTSRASTRHEFWKNATVDHTTFVQALETENTAEAFRSLSVIMQEFKDLVPKLDAFWGRCTAALK